MERLLSFFVILTAAERLRAGYTAEFFQCTIGDFHCEDGGHVPLCQRCDGMRDCGDGSDESGCQAGNVSCGPRGRQCGHGGPCLPLERLCDGHDDCPDGSDEAGKACVYSLTGPLLNCRKDEFRCAPDADCYPLDFVCDRHADCPDKRDELGCVFEVLSSPEIPTTTQPDSPAAPEMMMVEHWIELTIVALLIIVAAAIGVAMWVRWKARPLLVNFNLDKASERLMRKEQP